MSEITQRFPHVVAANPVHPNAKTTTHITNGTTTTKTNITSPVCRNCKTQTTPLWRRDETGQVLCNACGLFLKLHGRARPISLKTDTIKLRNRIKQPNLAKSSGPNTPELKLKDSGATAVPKMATPIGGKKSPKLPRAKKLNSGDLTPLLPAKGSGPTQPPQPQHQPLAQSPPQHPTVLPHLQHLGSTPQMGSGPGFPHMLHLLLQQVQLLHYPSLTPAQFAPGLQRITSPLLLLTTSLISNARGNGGTSSTGSSSSANTSSNNIAPNSVLSAAAQAAGALETMSHELGPLALFKPSNGTLGLGTKTKDVSLLGDSKLKKEFQTPSSALNGAPRLPSLGSGIASPSFGPQFLLQQGSGLASATPDFRPTSLPPIISHNNPTQQLPSLQSKSASADASELTAPRGNASGDGPGSGPAAGNLFGNSGPPAPGPGFNSGAPGASGSRSGSGSGSSGSGSGSGSGAGSGNPHHEITILKTRISELELVNDLYRTRIMELEAMEQAARLREISVRKRLDEVVNLQLTMPTSPTPTAESNHQTSTSQAPAGHRFSLPPINLNKRSFESSDALGKRPKLGP